MLELDNPTWYALTSTHKPFGIGTSKAKRYPANVLPFVGFDTDAADPLGMLQHETRPGEVIYIIGELPKLPPSWVILGEIEGDQMVCEKLIAVKYEDNIELLKLAEPDIPEMYALINSVQPGFFKEDTAKIGAYYGIRVEGRLVAMAGERLKMTGLSEVSAVCTHPDHTGKGYAGQLVSLVAKQMINQGKIPFLHVVSSNDRAIKLYERLGFVKRRSITFWKIKVGN
ncbi:GNAT family N-acetyltransferase [Pedobacter sp.]|jgi:ribosomal protein S18 acetylase RimI-like enzyme|uniref:GNAT family N-acetyltransferase n=1 Tax=Pedobacter sp. TaxID=1411316 RepID=UPI002D1A1450|nr:GNAT family N-acetyltransferase [Pedobacter sp.]HWW43039.1 GNAT family N-acetyltransferase [Pedobacter sp.]